MLHRSEEKVKIRVALKRDVLQRDQLILPYCFRSIIYIYVPHAAEHRISL